MIPATNDIDVTTKQQVISIVIYGEPASKANSRRVVTFGTLPRLIKSQKALDYSAYFREQCLVLPTLLEGDLRITLHIYYASRRPDLDESLILDLMQGCIYANDRQVKERHTYWHLDPDCPRSDITIECIPEVAPKKSPTKKRGQARKERAGDKEECM
jgi:Holliday junction resolvase RusA-like endonuclease